MGGEAGDTKDVSTLETRRACGSSGCVGARHVHARVSVCVGMYGER